MSEPESVESQLRALRQFFLLRYSEEARRRFLAFHSLFPLIRGTRLDLVHVNGASRVHFLYSQGSDGEHLVLVHDVIVEGGAAEADERRLVQHTVSAPDSLAHFVLQPPYSDRFDLVEQEAVDAVARHAKLRPRT